MSHEWQIPHYPPPSKLTFEIQLFEVLLLTRIQEVSSSSMTSLTQKKCRWGSRWVSVLFFERLDKIYYESRIRREPTHSMSPLVLSLLPPLSLPPLKCKGESTYLHICNQQNDEGSHLPGLCRRFQPPVLIRLSEKCIQKIGCR